MARKRSVATQLYLWLLVAAVAAILLLIWVLRSTLDRTGPDDQHPAAAAQRVTNFHPVGALRPGVS